MFGSDDDADFLAVNGSKLASLFDGTQPVDDGKATFTYAAPRQPKKGILKDDKPSTSTTNVESQSSASNKLSIIIVKAVHTFLLEDGKYNSQGKLGAALLGNPSIHNYQLLLYKGKQHHITSTTVTIDFQFTVQANNYSTFYTDNGQNWSLHFDNSADSEEFAREIGLARANSIRGCDGVQSLVTQVLLVPTGSNEPAANAGDSMEILYTVKTYLLGKFGDLVETNCETRKPQRVKIREHVWEEGLIGASTGTKRLLLLPPSLLGPWKPVVPDGTSLAVEVEMMRLKQAKGSATEAAVPESTVVDSTESPLDSSTDEHSIKARGASISEALTNSPKTHKASIISRMARMGQATLPLKGAIPCNPSDSEETGDESSATPAPVIPLKATKNRIAKPRSSNHQLPPSSDSQATGVNLGQNSLPPHQVAVYQSVPVTWQQQQHGFPFYSGALQTVAPHQMIQSSSTPVVSHPVHLSPSTSAITSPTSEISVFLSESRMHNTEVRMAVNKVADKVDLLLGKFDAAQPSRQNYAGSLLDSSNLLASVQKIVSENELLRLELADKSDKLECQNERIYQLLNANHKYFEKNNSSAADMDSVIIQLKQDKEKLSAELTESNAQVTKLQNKIVNESVNMTNLLRKQQSEQEEKKCFFSEQESQMAKLTAQLTEAVECNRGHEETISELRESMLEVQSSKERLTEGLQVLTDQLNVQKKNADEQANIITARYVSQIQELEMEGEKMQNKYESLKNSLKTPDPDLIITEVKLVMNAVWKNLQTKFDSGMNYDGSTVKHTLMNTIRDITIQYVDMKTKGTSLVRNEPMKVAKIVPNKEPLVQNTPVSSDGYEREPVNVSLSHEMRRESPKMERLASSSARSHIPPSEVMTENTSSVANVSGKITPKIVEAASQQAVRLPIEVKKEPKSFAHSDDEGWRPQPPPPPLFDDEEDDDDWLA